MILNFEGTKVNTEETHQQHMDNIDQTVHCSKDKPEQFFTVESPNPDADDRFVNLVYSEDGDKLQSIYYWDNMKITRTIERRKVDQCYFTKGKEECWEDHEVVDYSKPSYGARITVWERDNPKYDRGVLPITTQKKSGWRFW